MNPGQNNQASSRPSQDEILRQRGYRVAAQSRVSPSARSAADARRRQSFGVRQQSASSVQQTQPEEVQTSNTQLEQPNVSSQTLEMPPANQPQSFAETARAELEATSSFESIDAPEFAQTFSERMVGLIPESRYARVAIAGPLVALFILGGVGLYSVQNSAGGSGAVAGISVEAPDYRFAPQTPDATTVSEQLIGAHIVGESEPRFMSLFDGSKARMFAVGQTPQGSMETPQNIHDISWYQGAANLTDSSGAMVATAYVKDESSFGAFASLSSLKEGSIITVEQGDGTQHSFKVSEILEFVRTRVDMSKVLEPINPDALGLNLISSGNAFETDESTYSKRTLVRAELVDN